MARLKYGKTLLLQAGNNKAFLEYVKAIALGASEYELLLSLENLKKLVIAKLTEFNKK